MVGRIYRGGNGYRIGMQLNDVAVKINNQMLFFILVLSKLYSNSNVDKILLLLNIFFPY
jgi:hypothetical protein